ncbi:MAG: hypothetical protein R3A78_12145 [Polyangiales bacterium]
MPSTAHCLSMPHDAAPRWSTVGAQAVNFTQQTVQIETDAGTVQARYVIDATGPSAVLGRQFRSIEPIRGFGIASVYAHWEHVDEEPTHA